MKKIIWILLAVLLVGNSYTIYKSNQLSEENEYLEDENNDLKSKLETSESDNEDLKTQLDECNSKNDVSENSYELSSPMTEVADYTNNNENSSSYNSSSNLPTRLSFSLPHSLQTINFDNGRLISPTLENLHYLFAISDNAFVDQMIKNDYSLTTTKESYVNNSTRNCCYTIDKETQSVTMLFTQSVSNSIEDNLRSNNIGYVYDDGFRKYTYVFNNERFELYIQSSPGKLLLLLKNI